MTEVTTRVRKWGNSYGIIIPIGVLKSKGIDEGEEIDAIILKKKKNVLREMFGKVKFKKSTAQLMKETDEALYDI
jgi:antitoxin component of MazEF toxin-antitoxin module